MGGTVSGAAAREESPRANVALLRAQRPAFIAKLASLCGVETSCDARLAAVLAKLDDYKSHSRQNDLADVFVDLFSGKSTESELNWTLSKSIEFFEFVLSALIDEHAQRSEAIAALTPTLSDRFAAANFDKTALLEHINREFPFLWRNVRQTIHSLLEGEELRAPPRISPPTLLSAALQTLVAAGCAPLFNAPRFELLYNTSQNGFSFTGLSRALEGVDAAVLLILRHSYRAEDGTAHSECIAAFADCRFEDSPVGIAPRELRLFALRPAFRAIPLSPPAKVYFSARRRPGAAVGAGIGFGGGDDYALWIDAEMQSASRAHASPNGKLSLNCVEAWTTASVGALAERERARDARGEAKARGLRRAFAESAPELLLPKTFAFRQQLSIDIEHEKSALGN